MLETRKLCESERIHKVISSCFVGWYGMCSLRYGHFSEVVDQCSEVIVRAV